VPERFADENDEAGISGLSSWKKRKYLAVPARGLGARVISSDSCRPATPALMEWIRLRENIILMGRGREKHGLVSHKKCSPFRYR
jgi:hypothetical protein